MNNIYDLCVLKFWWCSADFIILGFAFSLGIFVTSIYIGLLTSSSSISLLCAAPRCAWAAVCFSCPRPKTRCFHFLTTAGRTADPAPRILVDMSDGSPRRKMLSVTLLDGGKPLSKPIASTSAPPAVYESFPSLHILARIWCYQTWFIWTLMGEKWYMIRNIYIPQSVWVLVSLRFLFSHCLSQGTRILDRCPARESNQWPFTLRDDAQPTEPQQSGSAITLEWYFSWA